MTYPGTILKAWQLFAKKELGQNFLADPKTAEMIVNRAGITENDTVLEIGSGLGALTVHAAKKTKSFYAVEKDSRLITLLKNELLAAGIDHVQPINQDIFKVDLQKLAQGKKMVIMGNLPYNISSQVLFKLVENREVVDRAVLMFQKELAERITAKPGEKAYGRLSAVMQYCSDTRTIADVAPHLFFPKPKVESRVVEVTFFHDTPFAKKDEAFLFKVIKAAFSKRRKTLRNSLGGSEMGVSPVEASRLLDLAGIDPTRRAETLDPKEFTKLTQTIRKFLKEP